MKIHFLKAWRDKAGMPYIMLCNKWFYVRYFNDVDQHFTSVESEVTCLNCIKKLGASGKTEAK